MIMWSSLLKPKTLLITGRTFPSHPYYSQYLSLGQLSLFNLLKAYSLLDTDVGYCQGLSFVAGILMLHVDTEDEAFELMRHLLFNFGLRRQYLPSMNALHLQLYQLTRLLRDHEYELFNHFDHYDISPTLYAAPWFLTLFASQFSLGFVARLLDLISLIGIEAIFRVSLNLLAHHRATILACSGLEATMEFLKDDLVNIVDKDMVKIFDKSFSLDLRNELLEYEIEYTFYCAEDHRLKMSSNISKQDNGKLQHQRYNNLNQQNNKSYCSGNSPRNGCNLESDKLASNCEQSGSRKSSYETILGNNEIDNNKPTGQLITSETKNMDESLIETNSGTDHRHSVESTSSVADATATVIIQHLLSNNHLKSLRSNYTY